MSDREFFKVFSGLLFGLVALAVVMFVLATLVVNGSPLKGKDKTAQAETAVAQRIKPVGDVAVASTVMNGLISSASADGSVDKGKATFDGTCVACHGAGVAGAPKFGDKAAWKPRIAKGLPTLQEHALKGFQGKSGIMPPKGGNAALSDADVKAAVAYMVSKGK